MSDLELYVIMIYYLPISRLFYMLPFDLIKVIAAGDPCIGLGHLLHLHDIGRLVLKTTGIAIIVRLLLLLISVLIE